jgi:hypothetical protein
MKLPLQNALLMEIFSDSDSLIFFFVVSLLDAFESSVALSSLVMDNELIAIDIFFRKAMDMS